MYVYISIEPTTIYSCVFLLSRIPLFSAGYNSVSGYNGVCMSGNNSVCVSGYNCVSVCVWV